MRQKAISARFPTSSVPMSCSSPRARAACLVAPLNASCGVNPNSVQAMLSASNIDVQGELPGLQSVAMATGTPAARNAVTGGFFVSRRK